MSAGNNAWGTDVCAHCGETYDVQSNRQIYCSTKCKKAHYRQEKRSEPKTRETTCECGAQMLSGTRGPARTLCDDCKAQRKRDRERARYVPTGRKPGGRPRTDDPLYKAVHERLKKDHGRAKDLPCIACGAVGAGEWAYLWSSSEPRIEPETSHPVTRGMAYSVDQSDYGVLCKSPCHAKFDRSSREYMKDWPKGSISLVHVAFKDAGLLGGEPK